MEKSTGIAFGAALLAVGLGILLVPAPAVAVWFAVLGGAGVVIVSLTPIRDWEVLVLPWEQGTSRDRPEPTEEDARWLIEKAEWATHNLLNADVSDIDEVVELRERQREWIERVADWMENAGLRQSDISRFRTLNRVPDHGLPGLNPEHRTLRNHISERIERLRGIAEGLEGVEPGTGAGVMSLGRPSLATGDTVSAFDKKGAEGLEINGREIEIPPIQGPLRETPLERAERLREEEERRRRREDLFNSEEGVRRARDALTNLAEYLEEQAEALTKRGTEVWFSQRRSTEHVYCLTTQDASFTLGWFLQWANSLENSSLLLREFDGRYSFHGMPQRNDPTEEWTFTVDFDSEGNVVWVPENVESRYSTREFADRCLERLVERHYARRQDRSPDLEPF